MDFETVSQNGKYVFTSWLAHPDGHSKDSIILQIVAYYTWISILGFKGSFFRSSNLRLKKVLAPLKGEIYKQLDF